MIPKRKLFTFLFFVLPFISFCQENSPYSRYGIGNLMPQGNVVNRGMGGISAGYADGSSYTAGPVKGQATGTSINFLNPATYSNLFNTTLDVGTEFDSRTLKSTSPTGKFTSNNAIISYLQVGIPLLNGNKKATKKNISWGMDLGLRPLTRINYKIQKNTRLTNIDSLTTLYEGSGGANEVFLGSGVRIKNFSFGFNAGYLFGNKDYSTRQIFINDTVNYYKSNTETHTSFGGFTLDAGFQYVIFIKKDDAKSPVLRLGAYGNFQKKYNGSQNVLSETFNYNSTTGSADKLDSVYEKDAVRGIIKLPATYGAGFTYEQEHLLFGLDLETTNWKSYRFYGQKDSVKNNWTVKAGFQYFPFDINSKKYWSFVKYRAGFYFGPDYISPGKTLNQLGVTVGAALPLNLHHSYFDYSNSVMNVGLEYATRGGAVNNVRENIFRITVGFSLSDLWFRRYKYD